MTRNGIRIPENVKVEIDALIWQLISARNEFRAEFPLEGDVSVDITVPRGKADLDNQVTTLLDCLQKAGIVKNDKNVVFIQAAFSNQTKTYVTIIPKEKAQARIRGNGSRKATADRQ